jgi:hypothetical protein
MDIEIKATTGSGTATVTIPPSAIVGPGGEYICIFHGGGRPSLESIATGGLSLEKLRRVPGAFAFCTTFNRRIACGYALMNPLREPPALLTAHVHTRAFGTIFGEHPEWLEFSVEDEGFRFFPVSFQTMTSVMTNMSVQDVTDADIRFE